MLEVAGFPCEFVCVSLTAMSATGGCRSWPRAVSEVKLDARMHSASDPERDSLSRYCVF